MVNVGQMKSGLFDYDLTHIVRQCFTTIRLCMIVSFNKSNTQKNSNQWFFRTICETWKKEQHVNLYKYKSRMSLRSSGALMVISGQMKKKKLWLWREKKANSLFRCGVCITAKSSMAHKPTDITAIRIGLIVHFVLSPLLFPFIHSFIRLVFVDYTTLSSLDLFSSESKFHDCWISSHSTVQIKRYVLVHRHFNKMKERKRRRGGKNKQTTIKLNRFTGQWHHFFSRSSWCRDYGWDFYLSLCTLCTLPDSINKHNVS